MINFTTQLKEHLDQILMKTFHEHRDYLTYAEAALRVITQVIMDLRSFILQYDFSSKSEEISFYKKIGPSFISELIYHQKIYHIEIRKPVSNQDLQRKQFKRELKKISYFYKANLELFSYYQSGLTHQDELLFVRGKHDLLLFKDDYAMLFDHQFCPVTSYKIAKMKANEQLQQYLHKAVRAIKSGDSLTPETLGSKKKLVWTDTKIAATELGYSLYANKSFNDGKVELKDIMDGLEEFFQIKLGTYYSSYQDMKMRKKSRTSYLNQLTSSLERKMDEDDDDN